MEKEPFQGWLENNLHTFENPAVYLGDEPGTEKRDWDSAKLKLVIVGGSTYENLTGNLAAPMLTRMVLEECPEFVVERAFFPNSRKDLEIFEKKKLPVFSLESKRRLNDFDIIAFSASFNGVDLNVIKMLDLCGIPVRRWDRTDEHPFILRGGQNDSNPAPYMNLYDALYIGEAEVNFVKLLKVAAALVKKPSWKGLLKKYLVQMQGVLIPELYHPVYESGKFMGWTHDGDAPFPVRAARIQDMGKVFIYAHPISNYLEEMGSGEILLSRGCLAKCLFCNEGNKERPYRELPADLVIDAVRTSMYESGAASVTLSAFCTSSYRQKRTVLRRLMEEVSPEVGLTSQRVDESASDYEFMRLSAMAGNKSVSFGVEGLSERLRTLVNKHATHDQILQAVENAIKAGYNKMKLFMISNLPTENEEDRKEWIVLARAVREIRDKYPAQKVQIRFNFTDLSVTPHTPFQWLKPTLGQRNLSPHIKGIQELGIRVGFGAGKGHSLDNILQLLHIGDDRLLEPMIDLVLKDEETYFRQVSKSAFDTLLKRMEDRGLRLDMYYRLKGKDEPLPWDIVNYGVKKEYLYKMLVNGLKGKETPKCDEACTGCGVEICPKKWEREETPKEMVKILKLVPTNKHLLMRLNVNRAHRYVPFGARKQLTRRALYLNDIPTDRTISASSDTVRANDWVGGVEYAETRLTKRVDYHEVFESKNNVFEIEAVTTLDDPRAKLLEGLICHSAVLVDHPVKILRVAVQAFLDAEPGGELTEDMLTVIKIQKEGFFGAEPVLIDARALVKDLWIKIEEDGFYLHALHDGSLSIYDLYAKIAKARWSEVVGQPAIRVDFYYEQGALSDDRCSEGHPLYVNPMNEQHCPRCR